MNWNLRRKKIMTKTRFKYSWKKENLMNRQNQEEEEDEEDG